MSFFVASETGDLGYMIIQLGISLDPEKVIAIAEMSSPLNVKVVRSFLITCIYYRRFISHFRRLWLLLLTC